MGPNDKSGEDAYRHTAQEAELDTWVPDAISARDGDEVDWKSFTLKRAADVTVTVVFDDDRMEGEVGLYDRYGMPVMEETKGKSDSPRIVMKGAMPAGKNFIRIKAAPNAKCGYTVQVALARTRFSAPPPE
jgi:hypothetical protein